MGAAALSALSSFFASNAEYRNDPEARAAYVAEQDIEWERRFLYTQFEPVSAFI